MVSKESMSSMLKSLLCNFRTADSAPWGIRENNDTAGDPGGLSNECIPRRGDELLDDVGRLGEVHAMSQLLVLASFSSRVGDRSFSFVCKVLPLSGDAILFARPCKGETSRFFRSTLLIGGSGDAMLLHDRPGDVYQLITLPPVDDLPPFSLW